MRHKVKLEAKNSSGHQTLYIEINHPDFENEVALTLVGEYRGNDIQIDFNGIDEKAFAKTLRFILSEIGEDVGKADNDLLKHSKSIQRLCGSIRKVSSEYRDIENPAPLVSMSSEVIDAFEGLINGIIYGWGK